VAWYNLQSSSPGSCSYAIVSTLSGAANFEATIRLIARGDGVGATIDIKDAYPISPTGVTFPGYAEGSYPTTQWSKPPEMALDISGGKAHAALVGAGLCGGACSGQTEPHQIRYILDFDEAAGSVALGISGNLPTNSGPAPDMCWFNQATLQCTFSKTGVQ
jgi:hypothetical protein